MCVVWTTFVYSFPMAAACGEYNVRPEDIQGYEAAGLELDHAYSILDVMTTNAGSRFVPEVIISSYLHPPYLPVGGLSYEIHGDTLQGARDGWSITWCLST